jgi:hypothetical protein
MNAAGTADQIFVTLDHWIVGRVPAPLQTLVSIVIPVATIILVFAGLFALTTVFERKGLGRIQNRYGPNRVGPFGVFQPLADAVKSLTKEDLVPRRADHVVHYLAPLVLVGVVFLSYAVLPVGTQHDRRESRRWRVVFLRSGRGDGAGRLHGRMVEPQQIFAAGRHACDRADDQLRNSADPVLGARDHDGGNALDGGHRGTAGAHLGRPGALECLHAVGTRGFHPVYDRGDGGDQPQPLRFARRRVGNYCRAISSSIPASNLRCSSWPSIWKCSR